MLLLLTVCVGCAGNDRSLTVAPSLPPVSADLKACFEKRAFIPKGPWSKAQVISIIGRLQASEDEKDGCGKRLISFYEDLAAGMKDTNKKF